MDNTETENDLELQKEAEESRLHIIAKVHDLWRCGRVATTYMLHRRNPMLKIRK